MRACAPDPGDVGELESPGLQSVAWLRLRSCSFSSSSTNPGALRSTARSSLGARPHQRPAAWVQMSEEPSLSSQPGQGPSRGPHREKTFANFVVSDENRLAYAATTAVAENPGDAYNPLVICGPTGVGKTHLLRAIAHYVESSHEDLRPVEVDYFTVSYRPRRSLLRRPTNGDLLLVSDRSTGDPVRTHPWEAGT